MSIRRFYHKGLRRRGHRVAPRFGRAVADDGNLTEYRFLSASPSGPCVYSGRSVPAASRWGTSSRPSVVNGIRD